MLFCIHLHFTCIKIHTFEVKCSWHLTHNHITEESWCQHFHCTIPKNSMKMLIIWLLFRLFFNHSDRNEAVYIVVQERISWPKFSLGIYSFWGLTIFLFTLVLILLIIHGISKVRVLYSFTHFSYISTGKMLCGITADLWDLFWPFLCSMLWENMTCEEREKELRWFVWRREDSGDTWQQSNLKSAESCAKSWRENPRMSMFMEDRTDDIALKLHFHPEH